jgi:hypothetical protein
MKKMKNKMKKENRKHKNKNKCQVNGPARKSVPVSDTRDILFAVAEFLGTGSQVPLLLVIDAI